MRGGDREKGPPRSSQRTWEQGKGSIVLQKSIPPGADTGREEERSRPARCPHASGRGREGCTPRVPAQDRVRCVYMWPQCLQALTTASLSTPAHLTTLSLSHASHSNEDGSVEL